jgi:RNA methyltransferase, TrmH family
MITSTQNNRVKLVAALQTQAKSRRKEAKIALEGMRLVRDAIESGQSPDFVLYTPDLNGLTLDPGTEAIPVTNEVMRHVSDTQQPQGIIGVFPMPEPSLPEKPERILILDAIRDPGNLGTILRAAAAAGVQAAILSPDCVDVYNPKVLRAGMGAHFRLPIAELPWERIAVYCQPLQLYLADSRGDVAYDAADWSTPWALIIGSEAHGVGAEAERLAKSRLYIPMAAETESINAAVAAGIILFEAARQRKRE